jgi:hypothetical protein
MKIFTAVFVGLAIAVSAQAAGAYVVQVVTTAPLAAGLRSEDTAQLDDVVQSAIRDVLSHAIAFTPTVVKIEDARVIGNRLYLVLLIADADGESTIEGLLREPAPGSESDVQDAEPAGGIVHPGAIRF